MSITVIFEKLVDDCEQRNHGNSDYGSNSPVHVGNVTAYEYKHYQTEERNVRKECYFCFSVLEFVIEEECDYRCQCEYDENTKSDEIGYSFLSCKLGAVVCKSYKS